ncbi:MAG: hypothetical protein J6T10_15630 [Methanobrevibacter sp.]|nr:hypothetical protein [Methanobrevibacter sp.]
MGACYSVTAHLTFRKGLVQTGLENVKEHLLTGRGRNVDFGFGTYSNFKSLNDIKTIDDAIKLVFVDHQGMCDIKHPNELDYNFNSAFDASYSWEEIIYDFFKYLSPCLEDGSKMMVYPDSGCTKLVVEDGKWKEM